MSRAVANTTRQVARDGLFTGVGAVVAAVAGFGFTVAAGRTLGPAGAGVVFVLTSLFTIVTTVLKLGTDTTLVRTSARLVAHGRPHDLRHAVRVLTLPVAGLSVVVGVVAALLSDRVAAASLSTEEAGAAAEHVTLVVVVLALLVPAQALTVTLLAMIRGLGDIRPLVLIDQVMKPVLRLLLAVLAAIAVPTVLGVALAWVAPVAVGFVLTVVIAVRRLRALPPAVATGSGDHGRHSDTAPRVLWGYSTPRAVAQAIEILTLSIGVVLVGRLADAEQAGLYAAVNRLALAGMLAWQAVRLVIAPQMAALLAQDRRAEVQHLHQTATGWITAASWPVYLVLAALAVPVLAIFGAGFEAAAPALVVVAVGMLVPTIVGPAQTLVLMAGFSTTGLMVSVTALLTNLGLLLLLAPTEGALGAAVAWSAALVVEAVLYAVIVRARLSVSAVGRPAIVVALAAAGTIAVPLGVATATGLGTTGLVAVAAVSVIAYLVALLLLRRQIGLDELLGSVRRRKHVHVDDPGKSE